MATKKESPDFIFYFISKIKRMQWGSGKALAKLPMLVIIGGIALFIGCNGQGRGFALPPGGVDEGKATFARLGCDECHSVGDIEWKGNEGDVNFPLGGEVSKVITYGELVTSIINPSHTIAKSYQTETTTTEGLSKMKIYNDVMTVQELVDLVTFLQKEYKLKVPETTYRPY